MKYTASAASSPAVIQGALQSGGCVYFPGGGGVGTSRPASEKGLTWDVRFKSRKQLLMLDSNLPSD